MLQQVYGMEIINRTQALCVG